MPEEREGKRPLEAPRSRRVAARRVPRFVAASTRAKVTIGLLAVTILVSVAILVSNQLAIDMFARLVAGEDVAPADVEAFEGRWGDFVVAQAGLLIATGIAFLTWFHRAYRNLYALGGRRLRYSPGWAVGGWFVPLVNLIRPYQVAMETWRESSVDGAGSGVVTAWWLLWLASRISSSVGREFVEDARSADEWVVALWVDQAAAVVNIVAAVLAILVVHGIDARQCRHGEAVSSVFE